MTDHTLAGNDQGIYEIQLEPNVATLIVVEQVKQQIDTGLRLIVHTAASPVYVREGSTIVVRDSAANVVEAGMYAQILEPGTYNGNDGQTRSFSLISSATATISIART